MLLHIPLRDLQIFHKGTQLAGSPGDFESKFAERHGSIGHIMNKSMEQNKKAIRDFLTENQRMIVIDEANQLLASKSMSTRIANMEYIRLDIYEHTRTPVAMIFTKYSIQDFKEGDMASFLEQFLGRGINTLDIPARMFGESEVYPILRHYVPPVGRL